MAHAFRMTLTTRIEPAARSLTQVTTIDEIVSVLRNFARAIAGADGVTVVRRVGDEVTYVDEDAISPLWTGRSFPVRECVSGMAMIANAPIVIPDIRSDPRVPLNLYLSTFVRSMAMFPIGSPEPTMAMGIYWREPRRIEPEVVARMMGLARIAGDSVADVAAQERMLRYA